MSDKKLQYYGGDGFGGLTEVGRYEIKHGENDDEEDTVIVFDKLSEALKYYDSLKEPKAFWDITRGAELIDCYTY